MSWDHAEYQFAVAQRFHKHLLWLNANCNVYFAMKLKEGDDWAYFAGNATHALETGRLLTSYATEAEAQTNYLRTTKDANNKMLAVLPSLFEAKYARLYIASGDAVTIHEWICSSYFSANEIISGRIEITDELDDSPMLTVRKSGAEKLRIGNLKNFSDLAISADEYGIGIGDSGAYFIYTPERGLLIKGLFVGSTIKTAVSGKRIEIDSTGITLLSESTGSTYGEDYYGEDSPYGGGIVAYINNVDKGPPFYVKEPGNVADFHFSSRSEVPAAGTHEIGDIICVLGELYRCSVAGTPGTFEPVGGRIISSPDGAKKIEAADAGITVTLGSDAEDDVFRRDSNGYLARVAMAASRIVGKKATGNVVGLTGAEVWAILGKETALTDYSNTSTIVGFSSFNAKIIKYGVVGNVVVCIFGISGTSNGGGFSFTLPIAAAASSMYTAGVPMIAQDNGIYLTTFARIYMDSGGSTVLCQKLLDGTGWTGSGTKACYGTITYLKG